MSRLARLARPMLLLVALVALAAPAGAIPPGGADPDTPGTSATVSPRVLEAGDTISFRVTGFPAGEIVSIKIDDGEFCSEAGVHGACVVSQLRIPGSGTVSGSLVLPGDLAVGEHWLRFLASEEVRTADGDYAGVKGYTARGDSDFEVTVAPTTDTPTTSSAAPDPSAPTTTSTPGAETTAPVGGTEDLPTVAATPGGVTTVAPPARPSAPTTAVGPPAAVPAAAPAAAPTEVSVAAATSRFPVVGVVGFLLLVALAGAVLARGRRARD